MRKYVWILVIVVAIVAFFVIRHLAKVDQRFYDYKTINPSLDVLKRNRALILTDVDKLVKEDWVAWPEKHLYGGDDWTIVPFYAFGSWIEKSQKRFPNICKVLERVKGLRTALLSKMKPHTTLKEHQGWADLANSILRSHYGVHVPERCVVVVEGEKKPVVEGEIVMFDDSKMHWAANESDEDRIILIVDVERPSHVRKGRSKVRSSPELLKLIDRFK